MSRHLRPSPRTALALSAGALCIALASPVAAETAEAPLTTTASAAFPRSPMAPSPTERAATRPAPQLSGSPSGYSPAPRAPSSSGSQSVRVDLSGISQTRMLSLPRGKSAIIELPVDARDVLVSDPKVADVVMSTPRRIYVLGVGAGQTDAAFFDSQGRQLLSLSVRVDQDISALGDTLTRVIPGSQIKVEAMGDNLILSGLAASAADADKAVRLAAGMVGKPEQVVNMISIAGPEQVMLKVKIVEVSRSVIKQLGFNLSALYGQVGEPQYSFAKDVTFGVNGSLLGGATGGYKLDTTTQAIASAPGNCAGVTAKDRLNTANCVGTDRVGSPNWNQAQSALQAFERVGLVRTLAEPNLTAVSGESAKFLAGGEFPVPTGSDNTGRVSVEFKPFGVGLGFTPVVLSKGRISLRVSTEVSELSNQGALTIGAGSTTTITVPSLNVRRAETMVELPSGGGMMIAGLLQSKSKQTLDSLPGLMELPVLGALFRSRDFINDETELVVIVTPYLVKSTDPDQLQTPADGLELASDMQTTMLGRLNRASGRTPAKTPEAAAGYQGPFGYVIE